MPTFDFSTLYTTLPHNLIKEKLNDLTEWSFEREDCHTLPVTKETRSLLLNTKIDMNLCRVKICEALIYLLYNLFIRFGTKLYRQIVGIPMGTNCTPLIADLFSFCYERDFMASLSYKKEAEIIQALNSASRFLDDLSNIDKPYFEGMVGRI